MAASAGLASLAELLVPGRAAALGPQPGCPDPFERGRLLGTLPLSGLGGVDHPLETLLGRGLDARLATDLRTLTSETLVIPNQRFFVRSEAPAGLDAVQPWRIRIGGRVRQPMEVSLDSLPRPVSIGTHLIECAGNNNPANFGLISAAHWSGLPIAALLDRAQPLPGATHVLISGMDAEPGRPRSSSVPGASWIFSRGDLDRWRPFLATEMNGEPLPRVHGAPVRLIVPRWYGCASIKWVNEIQFLDESAPATPHMREFARRTQQDGVPERARDFKPAAIDQAAMPIRVEKWLLDGQIGYRVVGVMWGGERVTDALLIGFGRDESRAPVTVCPKPAGNDTWSVWTYRWQPKAPGRYTMVLRVGDPQIPTRRLDLYYYIREVRVDEV